MLYSLFVSPLNLSMVFIPLYYSYFFASIFSAFCDLRLMNTFISIIASSMSMSFFLVISQWFMITIPVFFVVLGRFELPTSTLSV